MGVMKLTRKYNCWNDCKPDGCPSHEASIEFQSVSDALVFDNGKTQRFYIQTPELEAFVIMLKKLAKAELEIESALKKES